MVLDLYTCSSCLEGSPIGLASNAGSGRFGKEAKYSHDQKGNMLSLTPGRQYLIVANTVQVESGCPTRNVMSSWWPGNAFLFKDFSPPLREIHKKNKTNKEHSEVWKRVVILALSEGSSKFIASERHPFFIWKKASPSALWLVNLPTPPVTYPPLEIAGLMMQRSCKNPFVSV